MKKRKVLVSLLCATALLGVSAGTLASCKKTDEPANPENPTPQVQKFTVTFDSKGGSAVAKQENITSGSTIAKPADPTLADHKFEGWYKDSGCTVAWNFETDTVSANVTLYAKWTENAKPQPVEKFTVTFDSKGGSAVAKQENIEKGAKATKPADPTLADHKFEGWFTDEACTKAWNFESDTVTANVTLYAKWTENAKPQPVEKFTVTFNSKGGSAVDAIADVESGSKVAKPADPTLADNTFEGWYKDEACTEAWNFETDTVTANVTLYAKWTANETPVQAPKATLVYNNGAENGTLEAVEDGGAYYYDRPTQNPVKDYNEFVDWYIDAEFTTTYNWSTEAVDGITLYAKYEQKYDKVFSEFDFATASSVIGSSNTTEEKVVGRFTCPAGVRIDNGTTLNTQGRDITFELKGEGNLNGITITAQWASSSTGSFYIKNAVTGEILFQKDNLSNKADITADLPNLPAGKYVIESDKSIRISGLSLTEQLPQGPTTGIELNVSSVQTQYLAGRSFSSEGLLVYLTYENGRRDEIVAADYKLSDVDMTKAGTQTITVTYNLDAQTPYTATFDIHVYAIEELVVYSYVLDAKRVTHNVQTLFAENSTFNSNNIAVKAKCLLEKANPDDPQEYIEFVLTEAEYTVTPADLTKLGQQSVQIAYVADTTKVANYNIEVVAIPDYANVKECVVYVDPTHELGAGQYGPSDALKDCYYVQTINQALQLLELAQVSEDAVKTIALKPGTTYNEKVEINVPNVKLVTMDAATGAAVTDPANYAVIEFDGINGKVDPSETTTYSTDGSATISIRATANNFFAQAVIFNNYWNTAARYQESLNIFGNGATQAVAVLVQADKVTFENCHFSSYQDTLYAKNGRQYYKDCYIEGHTDFIFGDEATAVFEHCDIHTIGNADEKNGGYVVATKGKTSGDKELKYGYVFNDCDFTADDQTVAGTTSLGRAWAAGMSMMVMNSRLGEHISAEAYGDATSPKNDRYGKLSANPNAALILEYNNTGLGAITASLENTCTVVDATVGAEYTLNKIYGADNGSQTYSDVWMPYGTEMNATINLVDKDGTTIQTITGASYVGSTITESMLTSKVQDIEGKTIVGYYSDQALTQKYDYSTVLAETNTIYVEIVSGVVMKQDKFTASDAGYTPAVDPTSGKASGTDLKSNPYDGATFKVECSGGSKVANTGMTVAANDGSGLTFTTAFVPTGGSRIYTITAKRDLTIKVYFTISNTTGPMSATAVEKDGNLTVNGASVEAGGANVKYSTGVAYCYTIDLKEGETVTLTSTVSNLCLFAVIGEYPL